MKRWTIRISVLLLLGAIVNVAVAWGCVLGLANDPVQDFRRAQTSSTRWILTTRSHYLGCTYAVTELVEGDPDGDTDRHETFAIHAGWPMRSVWCHDDSVTTFVRANHVWIDGSSQMRGAVAVSQLGSGPDTFLPYLLHPRAFALNTIFYAAVLWALFAAPFALRRRRRVKRGLCPRCAYDLRAAQSDVCPECGAKR